MSVEGGEPIAIEKLVYGGDGLGRSPNGEIVFVPWSAPGDHLRIRRLPGQQKPPRGQMESIVEPGPDRVEPPCSVFGVCGGCQWQHISIEAQREWKRRIVAESLQRIGKLGEVPVRETLGLDAWHYRNRAQWEIEPEGETLGEITGYRLGYYKAQSHEAVAFDHCWIIPEPLNRLADWLQARLNATFQTDPALASGLLRVEALMNRDGDILISLEGELNASLERMAQDLRQAFPSIGGIVQLVPGRRHAVPHVLQGQPFLTETLAGRSYRVSAGSFFQTNPQAAEQLLSVLAQWLPPDIQSLVDLYAGVGVFALHFKDRARRILAVENAPSAVEDAQANIRSQGADHIELKTGDARTVLRTLNEEFDAAIVDPPRAGCQPDVLAWLDGHVQKQLLYVSCNPTTLARDLKTLVTQGWRIEAVQPIDMFPQTYHVETVVNLLKS